MFIAVLLSIALLSFAINTDPAPSLGRSKSASLQLECAYSSVSAVSRRRPGQVVAPRSRGDGVERRVLACTERFMRAGLRSTRDEAILSQLESRSAEFAASARSLYPELGSAPWLVEVHYPSPVVSAKIAFATKNALVAQGLSVSDRVPMLGAADIAVVTRLPPSESYAVACARYLATGAMREDDALLAVISRDPRETRLHLGLCTGGRWSWLG